MTVRFRVDVDGLDRLDASRRRTNAALLDTPKIFRDRSLPILRRIIRHGFATEGASTGPPWRALKASTLRKKRRAGLGRKILQFEGGLYRSLIRRSHPDQIVEVAQNEFRFGSRHRAMPFHMEGTRHMPARPPIRLTARDREELVGPIAEAYREAWEGRL